MAIVLQGQFRPALIFIAVAKVIQRIGIIRPEAKRFEIRCHGFIEKSFRLEGQPEIVVRLDIAWFQAERIAIGGNGFVKQPFGVIRVPEVVMSIRVIRP